MKEKNRNNSLMRSVAITLFVTSLCMFIMAEASYLISSRKVDQIATNYYRLVTEENSIRVSNWYTEQVAILDSNVFALEQKGVEDRKVVKQYLVNLLSESAHEYVYDIYYMYPDNVMLCGTDFDNVTEHPEINYNLRPWYVNAVATDHAVVSTAYLDTDTNKVVVTISKRVIIGGEIAGTLCMDMFITSLGDLINGEMMPENCYGSLVDSEFRTVFHPSESFRYEDEPPVMDSCGVQNYDQLKEALRNNKSGLSFTDYDGTKRTFYLQELSDTGWYVVSAIDNNLVSNETNSLRRSLFLVAAVILISSLAAEAIVRKRSLNKTIEIERTLERLRVEEEQRASLEEAKEKAEAANRSKTAFLFNMSHDIRTPMNAIIGFTNMAIKNIDDREKVMDSLTKTQRSSELLLSLINDVLEMSRIESGKHELVLESGNMMEAFSHIDAILMELAKAQNIDLKFTIKDIRDRYILVDKTRFNRVLLNLGTNAIKYTQSGGQVSLTACQLDREEDDTRYYQFTVSDNGTGMSEEFQKHMFEEFSREVNTTTSGIQGTGLGLSVTKAFVDIMGGTIACDSKLGQGTTFTVVLPMTIQEASSDELLQDADAGDLPIRLKGKRVLLVEDNELNREIAKDILQDEAGLIVETAEDGTVAVDVMRKMGADYVDFILMDIQMPYMNGYDATKAIRAMYPDRHIPIIALSANAFAEDKQKSLEAGMDDHIEKPIDVDHLFAAMSHFA